jgi:hypothetical protein
MVGLIIFTIIWILIIRELINAPEIDEKGNLIKNKQNEQN